MNQFRNISVTESEKLKKSLFASVLSNRSRDIYIVKGKYCGTDACVHVLVDCDKRQQFHEGITNGFMAFAKYGIILEDAWGHDAPQSFINTQKQFIEDLVTKPVIVKLQKEGCEKIHYLVSDAATENNFLTASSEEEIRQIGRILYCTRDEDPVESFCERIVKVYFGFEEYNSLSDNELLDSVRNGELQTVRTYLAGGGDVNFADEYGRSLLHLAAHSGNLDLVRFLIDKGANNEIEDKVCGRTPILFAAKEGHPSVISFLCDIGASIDECDNSHWTSLHFAVWKGDLNTIKFLVERGANINAKEINAYKKPIHIAAEHGYSDVIKYLIEKGASIEDGDIQERTPLYHSVMQGQLETLKFLIDKGADIKTKSKNLKRTLLHAAIFGNNKEIIEFLVKAGLDINEKDSEGCTPLHYAAYFYKLEMLSVLDDLGADFFAVNKEGENPLVCSKKKHADMTLHIVYRMCKRLQEERKYNDAVELYNENLEIIKMLRQDYPEYLEIKNKIGVMFYEMSQYEKAETILKDVLGNRKHFLGANHFSTLCTKHGLALVYSAQIRYSAAKDILKEVFESRKTILGDDHDDTLNVCWDLANVHRNKGEYDEALEMFTHIFEKRNKYFGSDHLKTLQARQDMAVIFVNKGDFKRALQIFKDVLQKRKILLGENHPETLKVYYHVELISKKIEETSPQGETCSIF